MKKLRTWTIDEDSWDGDMDSYTSGGRRRDVDSDALEGWEEAFLDGYENG